MGSANAGVEGDGGGGRTNLGDNPKVTNSTDFTKNLVNRCITNPKKKNAQ